MKRLFTLLFALVAMTGIVCAEEEPIVITAPDTVINKTDYSLSYEGVTVNVSYGSAYPAGHAYNNIDRTYFACLAKGSMTISANEPIQGIAINGWVKKNFAATVDKGTLRYLSDDTDDTVGEPVLTVSDIRSESVTIACDNQLRCFSIEVYFTDNPDPLQGNEDVTDTVRFTAVYAQAQDWSEDELYSSEGKYSYWLALAPQEVYPTVWLDMYAAVKGDLSGEYSLYEMNVGDYTYVQLGPNELDYEYAYDQAFTINKTDTGYHIEGYIIADNDVMYEFVYDGPIELVKMDEEEGIEAVEMKNESSSGSRKIIRDGRLLIEHGGRIYNVLGQRL